MLVLLALGSLAFLAALLAVPVDLRFDAVAGENPRARLRIEWLFGRIGSDLEPRKRPSAPRKLPDFERLSPLWQEAFRERVAWLLRRCRPWIDVHEIRGRAQLGLGDPADTGMAIGLLQPLLALAGELPRVELRVDPDFGGAGFRGDLRGGIRAVPLGLIRPVVVFALSPVTIRTFRRLKSYRS